MKINPDTLRYHRERCRLSQRALADKSAVSQRTISRIESGEPQKAHTHTIRRLEKALGIAEGALGQESPEQAADTSDEAYRKLTTHLSPNANLAFAFIEERYGVKSEYLIEMAPLLFLLLAEASLNWRRAKNIDLKSAFRRLRHHCLRFTYVFDNTEQVVEFEESSIETADLFGRTVQYELKSLGQNFECNNPFIEYLTRVAAKHAPGLVEIEPSDASQTLPSYMIRSAKIEELTGGDDRARYALAHGYARKRDIPTDLLGDDAKERRVDWLAKGVPEEEWTKHKAAETELRAFLEELGI